MNFDNRIKFDNASNLSSIMNQSNRAPNIGFDKTIDGNGNGHLQVNVPKSKPPQIQTDNLQVPVGRGPLNFSSPRQVNPDFNPDQ